MKLLIVFIPVNVNGHMFHTNINTVDYGMGAQTLMGDYLILYLLKIRKVLNCIHIGPQRLGACNIQHLLCVRH